MGLNETEKTLLAKVRIGPAPMISATTPATAAGVCTQDTAEPHPHPTIEHHKGPPPAVLVVLEPAAQLWIEALDGHRQTDTRGAAGDLADVVFELPQTLSPGPTLALLEVIAQEVEAARFCRVYDPRLLRVQLQAPMLQQGIELCQRSLRFRLTATQDHAIVRIADHLVSRGRHRLIHRMQIDVSQQRTDDAPNAIGNFEFEVCLPYRRGERVWREA